MRSVYPVPLTIQGFNLSSATSIITYPPGRILVNDFQATDLQVDAHVALAANTPTGIYTIFVATPRGISNGLIMLLTDPDTREFDGSWSGTTAQGRSVTLTVTNGGIERYSFDYQSGSCTGGITGMVIPPLPIRGNMFTLSPPSHGTTSFTMTGTFSPDSVTGTLDITHSGTGACTGHVLTTWTAHKS